MNARFAQKVVLVAGGTGGLGAAVSQAFLGEGATVIVTYRAPAELAALVTTAADAGSRLTGVQADVTDESACQGLIQQILDAHGRIDALCNCVGGYSGGVKLWNLETKVLDHLLALNLRTGYALARAAVPIMLTQRSGTVVNVTAKAAFDQPAGAAAYAASKAAAAALFGSLAAELAGTGIRVNTIVPSVIDTEANRKAMPGADFTKWPKPQAIAQVVLFLCSDAGRALHGANLPVEGYG
jgi:NAD(P)-dependent dehydrogenase (short-subunit alcohol dehydrogenase family)